MLAEIRDHATIAGYVMQTIREEQVYRHHHPRSRLSTKATLVLLSLRRYYGPRRVVAESGLPSLVSAYTRLFSQYDDYVDNRYDLPILREIRESTDFITAEQAVSESIERSPVGRDVQVRLSQIIDYERYRQFDLHAKYAYRRQPLPSQDAVFWREQTAGHLAATVVSLTDTYMGRESLDTQETQGLAYNYGANLQLLDDIVDLGIDLTTGVQNSFASFLWEQPEEYEAVTRQFHDSPLNCLSFSQLSAMAPKSLCGIQSSR